MSEAQTIAPLPASQPLIAVVGPTASGKSALGMAIANEFNGEIVTCDSVQVYRKFDIGSAKPTIVERTAIRHHLLDIVDCDQSYDAGKFAVDATAAIHDIASRKRLPIIVGGTGLYLRALLNQQFQQNLPHDPQLRAQLSLQSAAALMQQLQSLDAVRASQIHANDHFRLARAVELCLLLKGPVSTHWLGAETETPAVNVFMILLMPQRPILHQRISLRVEQMLTQGLVEETKNILAAVSCQQAKPLQSIGYQQVTQYLAGDLSREQLPLKIIEATRQYAKRQCTWFKKVKTSFTTEADRLDSSIKTALSDYLLKYN